MICFDAKESLKHRAEGKKLRTEMWVCGKTTHIQPTGGQKYSVLTAVSNGSRGSESRKATCGRPLGCCYGSISFLPGDFMGVVTMKKSTEMHPGFMPLCASALYFNTRDLFEKNEKEG